MYPTSVAQAFPYKLKIDFHYSSVISVLLQVTMTFIFLYFSKLQLRSINVSIYSLPSPNSSNPSNSKISFSLLFSLLNMSAISFLNMVYFKSLLPNLLSLQYLHLQLQEIFFFGGFCLACKLCFSASNLLSLAKYLLIKRLFPLPLLPNKR